jgi:hypothetical protein
MRTHQTDKRIFVELATPRGRVFAGIVSALEFAPANGVVQMEPSMTAYFGLVQSAEVTVRIGKRFRFFAAVNASASIEDHRFTVMAEAIQPTPAPVRNCANPACICGDDYETESPAVGRPITSTNKRRKYRAEQTFPRHRSRNK